MGMDKHCTALEHVRTTFNEINLIYLCSFIPAILQRYIVGSIAFVIVQILVDLTVKCYFRGR